MESKRENLRFILSTVQFGPTGRLETRNSMDSKLVGLLRETLAIPFDEPNGRVHRRTIKQEEAKQSPAGKTSVGDFQFKDVF